MKTIFDYLAEIKDFRRAQGQRISLAAFLEMVILAGMSGFYGINSISRFIVNNQDDFIDRYQLLHGVPKKTTVFNILKELDYSELNKVLIKWMSQYMDGGHDFWVSGDGKALGSTVTDQHGNKQNFKSIVSLFCKEMDIVVATEEFESKKTHEGQTLRDLIQVLELKGVTFTLDALHCQKKRSKPSWWEEMAM